MIKELGYPLQYGFAAQLIVFSQYDYWSAIINNQPFSASQCGDLALTLMLIRAAVFTREAGNFPLIR